MLVSAAIWIVAGVTTTLGADSVTAIPSVAGELRATDTVMGSPLITAPAPPASVGACNSTAANEAWSWPPAMIAVMLWAPAAAVMSKLTVWALAPGMMAIGPWTVTPGLDSNVTVTALPRTAPLSTIVAVRPVVPPRSD